MKSIIVIIILAALGKASFAQDTAYVSRDKVTLLAFKSPVRLVSNNIKGLTVKQSGSALITMRTTGADFNIAELNVLDAGNKHLYRILLEYSFGRAGKTVSIPAYKPLTSLAGIAGFNWGSICLGLASGKRTDIEDHQSAGGVKAWADKLSLAANKLFIRLDIRNRSGLPYEVDFVRFYIRDLRTVTRTASHEKEIVPVYTMLHKHTTILKGQEKAMVFAFSRFSVDEGQALYMEVYERHGNRHFYLRIKQKSLDKIKIITPAGQQPVNAIAAATR